MKLNKLIVLVTISLLSLSSGLWGQQPAGADNVVEPWNFTLEFEPIIGETVPGFHSFAYATYGSKWLIIGGRTNGLHGLNSNSNFETEFANNNIVVVDTSDWQWATASLSQLPIAVADPLRSTNMQFYQKGDVLYMVGGYGWDSTNFEFATFPTLTAIDVPGIINAVVQGDSIYTYIKQYTNSFLAVAGAELENIAGRYYLVGGHKFEGRYSDQNTGLFTQAYTDAIRAFDIIHTDSLYIDNIDEVIDTANLHRRDLNVVHVVGLSTEMLAVLGGVFKRNQDLPFTNGLAFLPNTIQPIWNFDQRYNQYTSAIINVREDQASFGSLLLGGMGTYTMEDAYDSLVPFSKVIALEKFYTIGATISAEESKLPNPMPGFLGTNAIFVPGNAIAADSLGIYELSALPLMMTQPRSFAGYLFGGIRGTAPNNGVSSANDTIYRVYFKGLNTVGLNEIPNTLVVKQLYPNPAADVVNLQLDIYGAGLVQVSIIGLDGKTLSVVFNQNLSPGPATINLPTGQLPSGLYFVKIETKEGRLVKKLIISH